MRVPLCKQTYCWFVQWSILLIYNTIAARLMSTTLPKSGISNMHMWKKYNLVSSKKTPKWRKKRGWICMKIFSSLIYRVRVYTGLYVFIFRLYAAIVECSWRCPEMANYFICRFVRINNNKRIWWTFRVLNFWSISFRSNTLFHMENSNKLTNLVVKFNSTIDFNENH